MSLIHLCACYAPALITSSAPPEPNNGDSEVFRCSSGSEHAQKRKERIVKGFVYSRSILPWRHLTCETYNSRQESVKLMACNDTTYYFTIRKPIFIQSTLLQNKHSLRGLRKFGHCMENSGMSSYHQQDIVLLCWMVPIYFFTNLEA